MTNIALVTGASRGIGRSAARALAREGYHVVAVARSQKALESLDDEIRKDGGEGASLVPMDLKDYEAIDRLGGVIYERWGKLDVLFDSLPSGLPHVKEGRLRALGITSAKRSPLLPDLPAISETVPGYETVTWFGLYGPKSLPAELATRLSTGINQALQDTEVKDRLARLGIEPVGGTPAQFAAMADADRAKWKKIITDRKISAE